MREVRLNKVPFFVQNAPRHLNDTRTKEFASRIHLCCGVFEFGALHFGDVFLNL